MAKLTDHQTGYLAALIDGEGTITLSGSNRRGSNWQYSPMVCVVNTNAEVLEWCRTTTNSGLIRQHHRSDKPKCNQCYIWNLSVDEIVPILKLVQPFLIIKQEQADLLLEYYEKCRNQSGREVEYEIALLRHCIFEDIRNLNKRGTT